MITPEDLTGEYVRAFRKRHKLTREQFQEKTGIGGKSTSRLIQIETKDSWKKGDREAIAAVINEMEPDGSGAESSPPVVVAEAGSDETTLMLLTDEDVEPALTDLLEFEDADLAEYDEAAETWSENVENGHTDLNGPLATVTLDENENLQIVTPVEPWTNAEHIGAEQMPNRPALSRIDVPFTITNSEAQAFKRCRRKWWLAWYRKLALRSDDRFSIRSTGTRLHKALEHYYVPEGMEPKDPRQTLEDILVEDWTKMKTAALELGHDELQIQDLEDRFQKAAALERAMIEGYVQWVEETGVDSNLKIVQSEAVLDVELAQGIRARGRIDSRAVRTTDNVRMFVDHKSVANLTSPVKHLDKDEQMLHYHLMEWLANEGEERCDGALYNMLRRVKRTASAKPPFYDRHEVRHNVHELESFKKRLTATARDIVSCIERLDAGEDPLEVVYPTPISGRCDWDCDFLPICTMFDDGSRVEDAITTLYHEVDPHERYDDRGTDDA